MENNKIPFKKINVTEAEVQATAECVRSGFIGLGNKVFEFEQMLAEFVGSKYVVAVDSCTSALFLSLIWERLQAEKRGDVLPEVGIPSMTVPLVAAAAIEAGRKIYYTDQTDWVGNVYHLLGTKVFDSAHTLERDQFKAMMNEIDGFTGNEKVCFSFYPTKNIGSADGGAIATNDEEFAKWAKSISCYGRNQGSKYGNSWDYEVELIGYKRHWTNLQAVVAIEQLKREDEINARRVEIRDRFNEAFGQNSKSLYLYKLDVQNRDEFIKNMAEEGIECGVHFKPLHMMKAYAGFEIRGDQSKIEKAYETTVSLPFYNLMTDAEVERVIEAVKKYAHETENR